MGTFRQTKCVPVTCRFLPSVVPDVARRGSRACRTSAAPAVWDVAFDAGLPRVAADSRNSPTIAAHPRAPTPRAPS